MIDLYKATNSPTGSVVAIMLEEASLPYRVHVLDPGKPVLDPELGEILGATLPMIVEGDASCGRVRVCQVGPIMTHLAARTGRFLPKSGRTREDVLDWVVWATDELGPAVCEFQSEMQRDRSSLSATRSQERVLACAVRLDERLGESDYVAGDYSIADMCVYPYLPYAIAEIPAVWDLANLRRWIDRVGSRPGVTQRTQLQRAARPAPVRRASERRMLG